ncbi:MAG: class A beta-lactamase-related serine hydrolase [Propionibacteriaceae bacterium]|jgi:hypothetical protein|nr:class A beta-lactamase-related serine hydrolase [Propionibacteriaceae bacterium]
MRRVTLIGLALLLAGCSGGVPEVTETPTGSLPIQLQKVTKLIIGDNKEVGAYLELVGDDEQPIEGKAWAYSHGYTSQSASMAKPMIVLMALRQARADGGQPTDAENPDSVRLSDEYKGLAQAAIIDSDNDAADELWAYAGSSGGYDSLATMLGLLDSHADPARDFWSWTWTTPEDQVKLMRIIDLAQPVPAANPELTAEDFLFLSDLMGHVSGDQAWGVGTAPREHGERVWLKNGWVQFESTDGLWAVNTMGEVWGENAHYRLCIMGRFPDFDTGKETLDAIGGWVYDLISAGSDW